MRIFFIFNTHNLHFGIERYVFEIWESRGKTGRAKGAAAAVRYFAWFSIVIPGVGPGPCLRRSAVEIFGGADVEFLGLGIDAFVLDVAVEGGDLE